MYPQRKLNSFNSFSKKSRCCWMDWLHWKDSMLFQNWYWIWSINSLFLLSFLKPFEQLSGWAIKNNGLKGKGKRRYFILRYGFLYCGEKDTVHFSSKPIDPGAIDFPDKDLNSFTSLNLRTCLEVKQTSDHTVFNLVFPNKELFIKVYFFSFIFRSMIQLLIIDGFQQFLILSITFHLKHQMEFVLFLNTILVLHRLLAMI